MTSPSVTEMRCPLFLHERLDLDAGLFEDGAVSLAEIKFDFDFAINDEGILSFTTSDLTDKLLLDFSSTPEGEQVMTVETQGPNWVSAVF